MIDRPAPVEEAPLGALFGRLVDDGKRLAKAEVAIQVAVVRARVDRSKMAVVFIVAALLLVIAAIVVLVAALGVFLAQWLTPAGGLAAAAVVALIVAGLLAKSGAGTIAAAAQDPVE